MNKKWVSVTVLLLAAGALSGCGTVSENVADNGQGADKIVFPQASDALVDGGTFPNIADLRQVGPGMTRDQLYQMFGRPHFHEGFRTREWDYLFNFRTGDGNKYVTCEFKVLFDKNKIAQSFYWKPASCANLINPKPKPMAPPPAPAPLPAEPIRLSSNALFGFDKYKLTANGKQVLDGLVDKVRSASQVENINVTGYTDRIGSDKYNMKLSKERADAVSDYLVAQGVPAGAITTQGRGEANPVVACKDPGAQTLIDCLAPNRRVEISGEAKINQ